MTKPDAPVKPRRGNSKDTRRWCKGVVGREHKWKRISYYEAKFKTPDPDRRAGLLAHWRIDVCERCGRHGNLHFNKTIPSA